VGDLREPLDDYRRHLSSWVRALARGDDPAMACARERASITSSGVASLHEVSAIIAKHNPMIAAAMKLQPFPGHPGSN
jgi:hypothetical protein